MKRKDVWLFLLISVVINTGVKGSLELRTYTACYGILGLENFLRPSCPGSQKIAVRAVYTLAKYKSSGCPQEQTPSNNSAACCVFDQDDCAYLYDSGSYRSYYQSCNGRTSCLIQVSWIQTPASCNRSLYIERTHYMKMDYYCISDQAVDPCSDLTTSDSPTFFWNSGYPAEITTTGTSCFCSVELSCDTTVQITALDLQLRNAGDCKQSIQITDGNSSATFECSSSNDFLPQLLYTSSGYFLTINFVNNLNTTGGKFFIQIQGSNPTGDITLSCGASALTVPSVDVSSLPTCPVDGETTTTDVPTTSTQTSTVPPISSTTDDLTTSTQSSTTDTTLSSTESSTISSTLYSSTTEASTASTETSSPSTPMSSTQSSNDSSTLESSTLSSEASTTASPTSTDMTPELNTTAFNSSDMTPEFTTLSWTTTENNSNASVVSSSGQPAPAEKTSDFVIPVVMGVVILAIVALLLFYRDRLKDCFCKKKKEEKEEIENNNDDENPLFQINIGEHTRFQSLPPLRHEFKLPQRDIETPRPITREHELYIRAQKKHENRALQRLTDKSWRKDNREGIETQESRKHKMKETNIEQANKLMPVNGFPSLEKQGKQNSGDASRKQTGKKKKSKKGRGKNKVTQRDDDVTPIVREITPSSLSFSYTDRRPSVTLDISDTEGILQKTVYFD